MKIPIRDLSHLAHWWKWDMVSVWMKKTLLYLYKLCAIASHRYMELYTKGEQSNDNITKKFITAHIIIINIVKQHVVQLHRRYLYYMAKRMKTEHRSKRKTLNLCTSRSVIFCEIQTIPHPHSSHLGLNHATHTLQQFRIWIIFDVANLSIRLLVVLAVI